MEELIARVARVSDGKAPMLITGETGTGKELLARAVHDASDRRDRQFIAFNCATASRELIESRLFGHERGAFTGADRRVEGVIRDAGGGTLLLDEVGELSLDAQPALLRFLQENEVYPLGVTKPIKTDVRVIAATNRDLEADVRAGRFRADLFYRLDVLRFYIPPLRERREDIRPLVEHFIDLYQQGVGIQGLRLSDEAWALMQCHDWPGNVRQLAAVAYRLAALAENNEVIGEGSALAALRSEVCAPPPASVIVGDKIVIYANLPHRERMRECERLSIIKDLNEAGGNITRAAERLGMSRNGLKNRIKRLGIEIKDQG